VTDDIRPRYGFAPRRVEKPWGWELVWAETEQYVGKLLFIRAGEALSLQYHEVKDESWLVREGRARLELGEVGGELEAIEIGPEDAFRFRPGTVHRVTALEDTVVLSVKNTIDGVGHKINPGETDRLQELGKA